MKNTNYQMITVKEYIKMLDDEVTYLDNESKEIKIRLEKHILAARRAVTNAKVLESLLA